MTQLRLQMLEELELRTPSGDLLGIDAIAITKWSRLLALAQCRSSAEMPEYLISVSLKDDSREFNRRTVPRMRIRASLN